MTFIVIITRSERGQGGETVVLKRKKFDAPSITAAKAKATKIANATTFLKGVVRWNDEIVNVKGKDLRWKAWDTRKPYTQDNGKVVGWSGKLAESFTGNYDAKLDRSPNYFAWITLYWEVKT